ncbi:hypothetical protein EDD86DRAFT_243865 [Gorgonomyces haynaldii]|nr:hypothetical protein EDD86DRAFT_243865 [Gorgonomyces haynaldii]
MLTKPLPVKFRTRKPLQFTPKRTDLLNSFRLERPKQSWKIFSELLKRQPFSLKQDDYTKMLQFMTLMVDPTMQKYQADVLLKSMRQQALRLDIRDYHSLFRIYLNLNDTQKLEQLYVEMRELDQRKPDPIIYNCLMMAYLEQEEYQKVIDTWHHMEQYLEQNNLDMHIAVKEALLQVLAALGEKQKCIEVFEQMDQTLTSFDAVIRAMITLNDSKQVDAYWNALLDYCQQINKQFGLENSKRKCHPSPITFERMMRYQPHLTIRLYEMLDQVSLPEPHVVELYIHRLLDLEEFQKSLQAFEQLKKRGILPTVALNERMGDQVLKPHPLAIPTRKQMELDRQLPVPKPIQRPSIELRTTLSQYDTRVVL